MQNGFLVHKTLVRLRVGQENHQLGKLQKLCRLTHFLLKTRQLALIQPERASRAKHIKKKIWQLKKQFFWFCVQFQSQFLLLTG